MNGVKGKAKDVVGPQVRPRKERRRTFFSVLAVLFMLAGLQSATQFFASLFRYQESLGSHLGHVYPPWAILTWARQWYGYYPDQFIQAGSVGLVVTSIGLLVVAVARLITSHSSKEHAHLYGSARWAGKKDIKTAGLLLKKGLLTESAKHDNPQANASVCIGGWEDATGRFHYLAHSGPEHVLAYGPTRSGKGVGLVVPTLLCWSDSCVITDLNGELWALSAGWRQRYGRNRVLRFEPASRDVGVCWNPLDEVRVGTAHEMRDVHTVVSLLVDPDGSGLHSHQHGAVFSLLVGVVLYALYKAKEDGSTASLPSVNALLADVSRENSQLWEAMLACRPAGADNHPAIGFAARDMMALPERAFGSVLSAAKSSLALYRDPVIARNVSQSDFCIKDLMQHEEPVSLYIVTQPNDKARLRPLVRILVSMMIRLLTDDMTFAKGRPVAHYRHRLLMMLDDFVSLGKLEALQDSLAVMAEYGITCYLVCQDINQLKSLQKSYGPDESITSHCHIQSALPPNRMDTAEHLSRITGQTTIVKEHITTSGRRSSPMLGRVSRTMHEVQRPLLTPDECMRMKGLARDANGDIVEGGDMLIYVAGYPVIYGKQPLYFKDPLLQARSRIAPPAGSCSLDAAGSAAAAV